MDLLERETCLRELDAALHDARGGAGRVVLLSGEAGIGKTTLIEHFVHQRRGAVRVLWGACDALFTPRPLGPLHDMAGQAQEHWAALLAEQADRTTIFAAVLRELQACPALVVFEDVHWADEATLDLLRFLGRRIAHTSALLVLTYRDDELDVRHPLRTVLGDVVSSSATRRIPLAPLSEHAVRTLVGQRAVDPSALHQQTGGNPFFVTEVLSSAGNGIPPSICDAVLARAARLSPPAQAVLQAAAVIGPRIEPWVLTEVTGAPAQPVEECLAIGMLVAQGNALAFRHELARQTVLDSLSPPQKAALHRKTLHVLTAVPTPHNDLSCFAHHAAGAADRAAVLQYAPAAAQEAAAASAHREAAALYALALRYADDLSRDKRALLLEAYAEQCNHVGQQHAGIAARRQAADLWRASGNGLKQGENYAYLMSMLNSTGQNAEAQRATQTAITILEALPPGRELALAYRAQAQLRLINRDYAEALVWAEKALMLAEKFKDAEVVAAAQFTIGTAWLFVDYERGCRYLEQAQGIARDQDLEAWVANIYTNLGSGSGELYQFHRAECYLAEGVAYTAERDLDSTRLYMLAWQVLTDVYLGRWCDAAERATAVLQSSGVTVISRITALVALGRLCARRGDPGVGTVLDEAIALATRANNLQRLGPVRVVRAEAAWLLGDRERTRQEARAVYDLALSKQHPWFAGELAFWRWRAGDQITVPAWIAKPFALQIAGDWQGAADAWQHLGCPYEQARALADGDYDAQITALNIFERLGAQPAADQLRRTMRAGGVLRIPRGPRPTTRENPFGLTTRQRDILDLIAAGLSNAQIASQLYLSPKTVDHHVSAVLARLDVPSRKAAAALAQHHPLLQQK